MKLHQYQQRAVDFMAAHPRCILSVGMGLGKTAATLHYIDKSLPKTCIIVAPKRVAETVWLQEAVKWGLFNITQRMVVVSGSAKQRRAAWDDTERPYKIVGRDNLGDLFGKSVYASQYFDMVVLDELTSFKSITAKRTKYVFELQRNATCVVGLTGTFLANGAIDIFGQMAVCGFANRLNDFYAWRATWFRDVMAGSGQQWHKWKLLAPLGDVLSKISDNVFTLDSRDWLDIPEVSVFPHEIELSDDERDRYECMQAFLSCNIDGVGLSVDESAKFAKLQTMCDGFVYAGDNINGQWTAGDVLRSERSSKLEAVAEFVCRCVAENENVLLFYAFKAEREWLRELLSGNGFEVAEVREGDALQHWMNGTFTGVLMAHPASAGHGLNLQGNGRMLVWSTLTYNYELYAQANARLARQGQRNAVQIHIFTAARTIEQNKQKALATKDAEQSQFLELTKQM